MQRLLLELYIQNGLHDYFYISSDIEKGDFITAVSFIYPITFSGRILHGAP